jgi:hypothetical protein
VTAGVIPYSGFCDRTKALMILPSISVRLSQGRGLALFRNFAAGDKDGGCCMWCISPANTLLGSY